MLRSRNEFSKVKSGFAKAGVKKRLTRTKRFILFFWTEKEN
jgi:hypothetical protein